MMLIRTYRVRGHLAANLDPLGLSQRELPADLTPEYHGFVGADQDRPVWLGGTLGFERATVRELVAVLRANYCGNVGLEYMHISDIEERAFLQERMEGADKIIEFSVEGKRAILNKVIEAEEWEKFLAKKYVGTKRFGLDGGESMIPAMEAIIKYGGQYGVKEIVYGMAHRGRLTGTTEQRPRIQTDALHSQIAQQPIELTLLFASGEKRRMAHFHCQRPRQLAQKLLQIRQAARPETGRQLQPEWRHPCAQRRQ